MSGVLSTRAGGPIVESQQPRISVVIPAYNAARHLTETLAGVEAQDFRPCEVIVIDDGSTDGTAEVAGRASPLVKCYRQDNSGPAAARSNIWLNF